MLKGFGPVNGEGNLFQNALSLATTFGEDFQFQRNSQKRLPGRRQSRGNIDLYKDHAICLTLVISVYVARF